MIGTTPGVIKVPKGAVFIRVNDDLVFIKNISLKICFYFS